MTRNRNLFVFLATHFAADRRVRTWKTMWLKAVGRTLHRARAAGTVQAVGK